MNGTATTLRVLWLSVDRAANCALPDALTRQGSFSFRRLHQIDEALGLLGEGEFDAVLFQAKQPSDSFLTDCSRLVGTAPATPLVVLTEEWDETLAFEVIKRGAQDCLAHQGLREENLAHSITSSIRRSRFTIERVRLNSVLRSLQRVTRNLARAKDPASLIEEVTDRLASTGGCRGVWVVLLDDEGKVTDAVVRPADEANLEFERELLAGNIDGFRPAWWGANFFSHTLPIETEYRSLGLIGLSFDRLSITPDEQITMLEVSAGLARSLDAREKEGVRQAGRDSVRYSPIAFLRWSNQPGWPVEHAAGNVEALLGYPATELLSGKLTFSKIIHPDDLERFEEEVAHFAQLTESSGLFHAPYRIHCRGGELKWIEDRSYSVRNDRGEITHFEGILFDITPAQEAAEASLASERQYREDLEELVLDRTIDLQNSNQELMWEISRRMATEEKLSAALNESERIFHTAGNGMRVVDEDFVTIKANAAFARICGLPLKEIVGKKCHESLPGEHCDQPSCSLERIRAGEILRDHEVQKETRAGRTLQCVLQATPLLDREGKLVGMVEDFQDLTENRRFQSIAEAVSLADNIGHVFGGIRHELGNPINNMKATLTVLNDSLENIPTREIAEQLGWVFDEITRVEFLLQSLKSFSLFENLRLEPFDCVEHIEKFLPLVARDLVTDEIEVIFLHPPHPVWVRADSRGLQQVLLNLVSNASQACGEAKKHWITLQVEARDSLVHLSVEDDGPGMDPRQLQNLFKPFYTDRKDGTGLGMAIVQKILARMDCTIEVTSQQGEGTRASIQLPASAPAGE